MNASIITTFRCNAHCHMCNIWKNPTKPAEEISPEILARLPNGLGRINFTGGEPMLRDDAEELVRVLYPKCRKLEISTNGYYTDRLVRLAEKFPRVMIRVSLEGLPRLNDKLRGVKDGFDHALRTILELKKTNVKDIGFSIVICDRNAPDLVTLYDLATELDVEFAQSTMHNSWYFHTATNAINDRDIVAEQMQKFLAALLTSRRRSVSLRAKDWFRAYFNTRLYQYALSGTSGQQDCSAGTDLFFVDPQGNVLPCNGSDERWIMGNLNDQPFGEIWHSERARHIREKVTACPKDCAFIGTARFAMLRNPFKVLHWIARNKWRAHRGLPVDPGSEFPPTSPDTLQHIPVIEREESRKLVIKH